MTHITPEKEQDIREVLANMPRLAQGVGTFESACSIAAINLALSNTLDDKIPECMSHVIGSWIIKIQDMMPEDMRNSAEWRRLLPLAAGTGRTYERERLTLILSWMWNLVSHVQDTAETYNVGNEWAAMTRERNIDVADRAYCVIRNNIFFSTDMTFLSSISTSIIDCLDAITHQMFDVAAHEATHAAIFVTRIHGYNSWIEMVQPVHVLQQLIAVTDPRALETL